MMSRCRLARLGGWRAITCTHGRLPRGPAANGPLFRIAVTVVVAAVDGMSLLLVGQTLLGAI